MFFQSQSGARRRRLGRRSAFTLLEVLLVLAILVVLTSTAGYYLIGAQKRANVRTATIQINNLAATLQDYHIDMGSFPTTEQGLSALRAAPAGATKWNGPYLEKDLPLDPWGNPYQYELTSPDAFRVWSFGPDGQDGSTDDVQNT